MNSGVLPSIVVGSAGWPRHEDRGPKGRNLNAQINEKRYLNGFEIIPGEESPEAGPVEFELGNTTMFDL